MIYNNIIIYETQDYYINGLYKSLKVDLFYKFDTFQIVIYHLPVFYFINVNLKKKWIDIFDK